MEKGRVATACVIIAECSAMSGGEAASFGKDRLYDAKRAGDTMRYFEYVTLIKPAASRMGQVWCWYISSKGKRILCTKRELHL